MAELDQNAHQRGVENPAAQIAPPNAANPIVPPNNLQVAQQQNDGGNINAITEKVKLPDFVEENTDLWFWQVEAQFEAAALIPKGNLNQQHSIDKKQYNTIIGQLPTRIMYKLSDLRTTPPAAGTMYNALKQRITTEFADSTQTKITKLLGEMSLGDRKPSQLLAEMRTKAANTPVTDQLLSELWQRTLPAEVRAILSAAENMPLAQSAAQADRIMDAIRGKPGYIHAIQPAFTAPQFVPTFQPPQYTATFQPQPYGQSNSPPASVLAPIHHQPSPDIEHLQQQMNKITQMFTEFVGRSRSQAHNSNAQRSQTPARQQQPQQNQAGASSASHGSNAMASTPGQPKFDTCWWHFKFGATARKCKPPCNFTASNQSNSGN